MVLAVHTLAHPARVLCPRHTQGSQTGAGVIVQEYTSLIHLAVAMGHAAEGPCTFDSFGGSASACVDPGTAASLPQPFGSGPTNGTSPQLWARQCTCL